MSTLFLALCRPAKLVRSLLLAAVLPMLVACGTPVMKAEQAATVRKVGIVSLLPNELSYQKIGITVFNNEYAKRPVGDAFNLAARSSAERTLKLKGREVVQLEVDVPALAKRIRSGAIIFDSSAERISDALEPLVKQHKLDAIVLIMESFDSENGINGIRLFMRAGFNDIKTAIAMPDIATLIVDANIKKLAAQGRGIPFAIDRPDGQPWTYRLEENLDPATNIRITNAMQGAIGVVASQQINAMGL